MHVEWWAWLLLCSSLRCAGSWPVLPDSCPDVDCVDTNCGRCPTMAGSAKHRCSGTRRETTGAGRTEDGGGHSSRHAVRQTIAHLVSSPKPTPAYPLGQNGCYRRGTERVAATQRCRATQPRKSHDFAVGGATGLDEALEPLGEIGKLVASGVLLDALEDGPTQVRHHDGVSIVATAPAVPSSTNTSTPGSS